MPIVGHQTIRDSLAQRFRDDRLAHALLFAGPPGIGKALVAAELAQRVVCQQPDPPCGDCAQCMRVAARSHPDIRFIAPPPGKKEIGVDLAREVKHFVQMASVESPCKIVVIDQAGRLSIAAQNALLKTLEEPPGRALIILVTDGLGALLPTVRSRCQRIGFSALDDQQLAEVLDGLGIDTATAETLTGLAQGSPGRALELAELIDSGAVEHLESSVAALSDGRYVSTVAFAGGLGKNEVEMTSRLALLGEILQQRLRDAVMAGEPTDIDRRVRALQILADARQLLRYRNPNRSLLAEATALKLSNVS